MPQYTVVQLKAWLRDHGMSTNGNKDKLVERILENQLEREIMTDQGDCVHADLVNGGNATHAWKRCKDCKKIVHRVHKAEVLHHEVVVPGGSTNDATFSVADLVVCPGTGSGQCVNACRLRASSAGLDMCGCCRESGHSSHLSSALVVHHDETLFGTQCGCGRRNVAGNLWHERMKLLMQEYGLCPQKVERAEKFRFGDARIEHSDHAWQYPVRLGNSHVLVMLDIAEVSCACPALLSNGSMENLKVVLGFDKMGVTSSKLKA
eukprot:5667940-Amphidinium_carterae.4